LNADVLSAAAERSSDPRNASIAFICRIGKREPYSFRKTTTTSCTTRALTTSCPECGFPSNPMNRRRTRRSCDGPTGQPRCHE
jgi:hypothetical protein